jgi:hypothetical protein
MHRSPRYLLGALSLVMGVAACSNSTSKTSSSTSTTSATSSGSSSSSSTAPVVTTPEVNPAGDIPDNQVYVPFTDPSGPFTVKVPEGWSRTSTAGAVIFTDKLNSIRLEVMPAASAPTVASATANEVPTVQASSKSYKAGKVSTVQRAGGSAVLVTYEADSAPDPVTGKTIHLALERYEFWKAGKEAILTLSGPVGADNVDPWKTVTDGFAWQ